MRRGLIRTLPEVPSLMVLTALGWGWEAAEISLEFYRHTSSARGGSIYLLSFPTPPVNCAPKEGSGP